MFGDFRESPFISILITFLIFKVGEFWVVEEEAKIDSDGAKKIYIINKILVLVPNSKQFQRTTISIFPQRLVGWEHLDSIIFLECVVHRLRVFWLQFDVLRYRQLHPIIPNSLWEGGMALFLNWGWWPPGGSTTVPQGVSGAVGGSTGNPQWTRNRIYVVQLDVGILGHFEYTQAITGRKLWLCKVCPRKIQSVWRTQKKIFGE